MRMTSKRRPDTRTWGPAQDGVVLVDKPQGWSSHDVVGRLRYLARTRKVGHAGTLDPMATGVLVVGVGRATRLLTYLVGADKDYEATIRLGVATSTDDAEGEQTAAAGAWNIDPKLLAEAVAALTGDIEQVPTTVSAIKIDGKRAYARARAGEEFTIPARPVTVSRLTIEASHAGVTDEGVPVIDLDATISCSSGTYVRALARDLGAALGTGGHLTALRRTRVGTFGSDRACTPDDLAEATEHDGALTVSDLATVAGEIFPLRELDEAESTELRHGRTLPATGSPRIHAAISPTGTLVALVEDSKRQGLVQARPVTVFEPA